MHFNRFGGTIPGAYWGCCACDIIQDFNKAPDAKVAIQIAGGDSGMPIPHEKGGSKFVGTTYREIFTNRLRFGTHSSCDMPNHGFIAIITDKQLQTANGKAWLAILKEHGFEFIRTVSNSVYSGATLYAGGPENGSRNYVFALFRNIGTERVHDPFSPPKEWADLPSVKPEAWQFLFQDPEPEDAGTVWVSRQQEAADVTIWDKIGPAKFLTEEEAEKAGCEIHYAGKRSRYPQQTKAERQRCEQQDKNYVPPQPSPFAKKVEPVIDTPQKEI